MAILRYTWRQHRRATNTSLSVLLQTLVTRSLSRRMRPCVPHFCGDLRLKPLEVLPEEVSELRGLLVVIFAALPGPAGVEEITVDSWHLDGHVEAEERVLPRLGVVELAPDYGAYHLSGGGDIYAATDAVGAAGA